MRLAEIAVDPEQAVGQLARRLAQRFEGESASAVLERAIGETFRGRIAVVSSFGAESAVLLHLVAAVDPDVPVLFLDTRRHFDETLRYRDELVGRLGLTDVRLVGPNPKRVAAVDPDEFLFQADPDRCCELRKAEPLAKALRPFDAWISGRKRYQADTRASVPVAEVDGLHVKLNPLAAWGRDEIEAYAAEKSLPAHPMVAKGFPSIGCLPCTSRVAPGEDPRAGRWRGRDKMECGIHLGLAGLMVDGGGI